MIDPVYADADTLWMVGHHVLAWLRDGHSVAVVTHDGTLDAISLVPVATETGIPLHRLLSGVLEEDEQRPLIDAVSDGLCSRIGLVPAADPATWQGHDYLVLRAEDVPAGSDLAGFVDVIVVDGPVPSISLG